MQSEKLPPHDTDAEENVIGSLLIDGNAVYEVSDLLQPPDFYNEQNLMIYEACLSLYQRDEAIDQITVAQELSRRERLDTCGGPAYLSHLISVVPTFLHIKHYAQIVYRLATMRRLSNAVSQNAAIGYEADPDVDSALNKAEDTLFRLRHGVSARGLVPIRQLLDAYFETTRPAEGEGYPYGEMPRVLSGFAGLDEFLGGFEPSDLIIVAGRPSMGKTSLALGIARNAALGQGACVALFSQEMARDSLVLRLLSTEAGVNSRRIRLGTVNEADEKRIMEAMGKLSEAPIYVDDSPQLRVVEMRSKARRLHFERGINLIITDYLQLMHSDVRVENRVQEISYISRSLKALARELNVPVLAVSQLSRAAEFRASHIPQLSDLRESGSIEQDADVVVFIYRDEYYYRSQKEWEDAHPGEVYPPPTDIIIAKHRNGPTGQVKLRFRHNLAKFENVSSEEPSLL